MIHPLWVAVDSPFCGGNTVRSIVAVYMNIARIARQLKHSCYVLRLAIRVTSEVAGEKAARRSLALQDPAETLCISMAGDALRSPKLTEYLFFNSLFLDVTSITVGIAPDIHAGSCGGWDSRV